MSDDQTATAPSDQQPAKEPALKSAGLTLEEHDMLLTAQATSDATVIQLQVAELLKEARVQLQSSQATQIAADLRQLRAVLQAISPCKVQGTVASGFIQDLGLSPAAVSLAFQPPSVVAAIGSLPLNAAMAHSSSQGLNSSNSNCPVLDVAVVMPSSCFFKKAHLNYRYHAMRALYLATLTNHLAASPAFAGRPMHLEALQQDPTRPVLLLGADNSNNENNSAYLLRIIPCLSASTFPLPRLSPDRNGVRWVHKQQPAKPANASQQQPTTDKKATVGTVLPHVNANGIQTAGGKMTDSSAEQRRHNMDNASLIPTPAYNHGILSDMVILAHAALLHKAASSLPAFSDGLLLLKVWAHQQGLAASSGCADGLDGHCLAMLLSHLQQAGQLTPAMSALQIFRCGLQALGGGTAVVNSLSKGIAMSRVDQATLQQTIQNVAHHMLYPSHLGNTPVGSGSKSQVHHSAEAVSELVSCAIGSESALQSSANGKSKGKAATSSFFSQQPPSLTTFKKAHAAVVLDPTGWCNCTWQVTKSALSMLQSSAKATLALLNTPSDADAALSAVLLTPNKPAISYDYLWGIQMPQSATYHSIVSANHPHSLEDGPSPDHNGHSMHSTVMPAHDMDESNGNGNGQEEDNVWQNTWAQGLVGEVSIWRDQESAVESLIKTALTDRAKVVRVIRRCVPTAEVSQLQQGILPVHQPGQVLVGAKLDPTLALRLVDIGPAADDTARAAKFREFWGPISELRRFQDGKICEAVVWGSPASGPGSRHTIPDQVVSYVVTRHKPAGAPGSVRGTSGTLDTALRGLDDNHNEDSAVMAERQLDTATDKLSKQLRNLEGLALKIVAVQPIAAACRHTCIHPPQPHPLAGGVHAAALGDALQPGGNLARCMEPIELLVQLENSGRWPANPIAFNKMKAALGLQLARMLQDTLGLNTQASEEYVNVFSDGFAFRLQLYSGRDEAMLLQQSEMMSSSSFSQTEAMRHAAALAMKASPEVLPLVRTWHQGLISRVAGANPSYAPACRLAKRWVAAHMLSNHVKEEAVELLMAWVYSDNGPRGPPGSRITGFLRFLQVLSLHPWQARPLIIDPDHSLDAATHTKVQHNFTEQHKQGDMPAMYIATPRDLTSTNWTQHGPSPTVVSHMSSLAGNCLAAAAQLLEADVYADSLQLLAEDRMSDMDSVNEDAIQQRTTALIEMNNVSLLGALFTPQTQHYHMLVKLRHEALPKAMQALPTELGPRVKRARQPDALSEFMIDNDDDEQGAPPPKRSRAFLEAFPDKAVQGRSPAALRDELLVGFNPVSQLLTSLKTQLFGGHGLVTSESSTQPGTNGMQAPQKALPAVAELPVLATLWSDEHGGKMLGLKWSPTSFIPTRPMVHTCHTSLPCIVTDLASTMSAASSKSKQAATGPMCVPDVARILSDMCVIGEGIIEGLQLPSSCLKLPVGSL